MASLASLSPGLHCSSLSLSSPSPSRSSSSSSLSFSRPTSSPFSSLVSPRCLSLSRPSSSSSSCPRSLSLPSLFLPPLPAVRQHSPSPPSRRSSLPIYARRSDDSVTASQRIIASIGYFLPLLDGFRYGRFLFLQFPSAYLLFQPLGPLIKAYNGFPYAGFIAFFALYIGVIQNQNLPRYVRYNCMQAVILDILMILPSLVERLISPGGGGIGLDFIILVYNTVFIYLFSCFVFGVGSCLLGKTPRLPIVADAAEAQVPF